MKKGEPGRNVKETMAKASSSMKDAEPEFNKEAEKELKHKQRQNKIKRYYSCTQLFIHHKNQAKAQNKYVQI